MEIPIGSLWDDITWEGWRVKVTSIKNNIVKCVIIQDPDNDLPGLREQYELETFLTRFKPVYIVEGFEV